MDRICEKKELPLRKLLNSVHVLYGITCESKKDICHYPLMHY